MPPTPPADDIFGGQAPLLESELGPIAEVASFLRMRPEALRQIIVDSSIDQLIVTITPFARDVGMSAEIIAKDLRTLVHASLIAPPLSDDIN